MTSCCGVILMPTELLPASTSVRPQREITGRFVLIALLAFFGVIIAVNGTMLYLATSTFSGADARNGYDVSQNYNREIAAARAQAERGWRGTAQVVRTADGAGVLLDLRDSGGAPVTGLDVEARLRHPSNRHQDHAFALRERAPGRYDHAEPGVLPGAWDVVFTARRNGEKVYATQSRIILKP